MPRKADHGRPSVSPSPPSTGDLADLYKCAAVSREASLDGSVRGGRLSAGGGSTAIAEVESLVNAAGMATRVGAAESRLADVERRLDATLKTIAVGSGAAAGAVHEDPTLAARVLALEAALSATPPAAAMAKMMKRLAECTLHLEEQVNELSAGSAKLSDSVDTLRAGAAKSTGDLQDNMRHFREQAENDVHRLRELLHEQCVALHDKVDKRYNSVKDALEEEGNRVNTIVADLHSQLTDLRDQIQMQQQQQKQQEQQQQPLQEHALGSVLPSVPELPETTLLSDFELDDAVSTLPPTHSSTHCSVRSQVLGSVMLVRSQEWVAPEARDSHAELECAKDRFEAVEDTRRGPEICSHRTPSAEPAAPSPTADGGHIQTAPPILAEEGLAGARTEGSGSLSLASPLQSPAHRASYPLDSSTRSASEHMELSAGDASRSKPLQLSPATSSGRLTLTLRPPSSPAPPVNVEMAPAEPSSPAAASPVALRAPTASAPGVAPANSLPCHALPATRVVAASSPRSSPLIAGRPLRTEAGASPVMYCSDLRAVPSPAAASFCVGSGPSPCNLAHASAASVLHATAPAHVFQQQSPTFVSRSLSPTASIQQGSRAFAPTGTEVAAAASAAQRAIAAMAAAGSPPSTLQTARSGSPGGRATSPGLPGPSSVRATSPVGSLDGRAGSAEGEMWQRVDDVLRNIGEKKMRQERHDRLATKMESGLRRLIEKLDQTRPPGTEPMKGHADSFKEAAAAASAAASAAAFESQQVLRGVSAPPLTQRPT